jgi:hypothetical protein
MGVSGQRQAPAALPPGKRLGTHCIGGWVGSRAGLDIKLLVPVITVGYNVGTSNNRGL